MYAFGPIGFLMAGIGLFQVNEVLASHVTTVQKFVNNLSNLAWKEQTFHIPDIHPHPYVWFSCGKPNHRLFFQPSRGTRIQLHVIKKRRQHHQLAKNVRMAHADVERAQCGCG
ncbi:hypothetical protein D1872_235140 [compost metagenome]